MPRTPRSISDPAETREARARRRVRIAQTQADLAYFHARLTLIGKPATLNQTAQERTFRTLHKAVGQKLLSLRGGSPGVPGP
jgi:hypothetical protein